MVQSEKEKERCIQESVKEFEKILRKAFGNGGDDFYGMGFSPLTNFIHGDFMRTVKNDLIKFPLAFKAKELVVDECKGIPMKNKHYKCYPMLIFLHKFPLKEMKK